MTYRKKLIEVALPLEAINKEAAREKSIRHGHPSTLHLWWARRPLAACRAVLFAQLVDDPSSHPEIFPTVEAQDQERQRLFRLIEELVKWDNVTNEMVLNAARAEIRRSCGGNPPPVYDPFAGGGSIPLEAQRLGLEAHASDLNPVAVLINKALIEIPPKWAGNPPVNPKSRKDFTSSRGWRGAEGLAEDVRYYGQWMRDEAEKRIGHLYPKVTVTAEMAKARPDLKRYEGKELTVIAWLWARTVPTPNPAFAGVEVPLVSTFMLSTKPGKETYVEPVVEGRNYRFEVRVGKPDDPEGAKAGTKLGRGANFRCIVSASAIQPDYIKDQGKTGKMGQRLMAIVAEGDRSRVYLSPTSEMEEIGKSARPEWTPDTKLPDDARNFWTLNYGLDTFGSLFTPRQLVALNTFCDLVQEARTKVEEEARTAGLSEEGEGLEAGGVGAKAYAEAVAVYLAFAVSKAADRNSSLCVWENKMDRLRGTFGRQALPMTWDFVETNPFAGAGGDIYGTAHSLSEVMDKLPSGRQGKVRQHDAQTQTIARDKVVSTDPPYYDNIGYADLSDYFYLWLRRGLRITLPDNFSTMAVPKAEELIASPYRHGGKAQAEQFFMEGMTAAMRRLAEQALDDFPVTIYYAFKQSENDDVAGQSSTGWETFLEAVLSAGFSIHGTWPMRTELANRMIGSGTNALASSIVLVCRKKDRAAAMTSRKDFLRELRAELPKALRLLQQGNIAPVDLAQASIGPGMAVFSRHSRVVEANGDPMTVKTALGLINQMLDEVLAEQEGEFDPETRWALAWFEQFAFDPGQYGDAETLSKAKNTSVAGLVEAGFLEAKSGKVRLLTRPELSAKWDPREDKRLTIWEVSQHLIRVLETKGEAEAGALLRLVGGVGEVARDLAYRLYTLCERKKWAEEARAYNGLVIAWPELQKLAAQAPAPAAGEGDLFGSRV
jgi:putative DNA methylase